jgi:acetyl-CoA carboxylase biotin carboxyl carrier protein
MTLSLTGRLHAPTLAALADPPTVADARSVIYLRAPRPGIFVPAVHHGELVSPGSVIGELVVLRRSIALIAARATGFAMALVDQAAAPGDGRSVAYGDVLFGLDQSAAHRVATGDDPASPAAGHGASHALVFRAPTSGRFYGRPAPDKPAFVTEGLRLVQGATICLLEVMKTFNRVTYGGPELPDTAVVTRVLVAEGADVNAGDPLLALE